MKALLAVVIVAVVVVAADAATRAKWQRTEPRPITFWADQDGVPPPTCADKQRGYVVLSGQAFTTAHLRVWVCGIGR